MSNYLENKRKKEAAANGGSNPEPAEHNSSDPVPSVEPEDQEEEAELSELGRDPEAGSEASGEGGKTAPQGEESEEDSGVPDADELDLLEARARIKELESRVFALEGKVHREQVKVLRLNKQNQKMRLETRKLRQQRMR